MSTYAPPTPTLSGDKLTVSYLLNNPLLVQRLLRTLVERRLIGGRILTGRVDMTGTGAAIYETSEPIDVDRDAEIIDQLADYPLVTDQGATTNLAASLKRGFKALVSDEDVSRNRLDVVNRKLIKMTNRIVTQFDALVLSAVGSAVSQTQAAAAAWNTSNADQFLDLLLSGAKIETLDEGYEANTVVAKPEKWARLVATIAKMFAAAIDPSTLRTGTIFEIAGLTLLKSPRMPSGTDVIVLDNTQLGSIGWEDLGGNYDGDPSDPLGVESFVKHDDDNDAWKIQMRKVGVPMVQEPGAAVKVTGV